jgi:hypothetical protein
MAQIGIGTSSLANRFHGLKEIASRAGQAIKFPDNDRVARPNLVEHALELGAVRAYAGHFLPEDLFTTRLSKGLQLEPQVLFESRDTSVADFHVLLAAISQNSSQKALLLRSTFATKRHQGNKFRT